MPSDLNLSGYRFARAPIWPLHARVIGVVFLLTFLAGLGVAALDPTPGTSSRKLIGFTAGVLGLVGVIAVGTPHRALSTLSREHPVVRFHARPRRGSRAQTPRTRG